MSVFASHPPFIIDKNIARITPDVYSALTSVIRHCGGLIVEEFLQGHYTVAYAIPRDNAGSTWVNPSYVFAAADLGAVPQAVFHRPELPLAGTRIFIVRMIVPQAVEQQVAEVLSRLGSQIMTERGGWAVWQATHVLLLEEGDLGVAAALIADAADVSPTANSIPVVSLSWAMSASTQWAFLDMDEQAVSSDADVTRQLFGRWFTDMTEPHGPLTEIVVGDGPEAPAK